MDANFKATGRDLTRCETCLGTGIGLDSITPCPDCNGTGYFLTHKLDITAIMEELDYIHGKVTAIWNQIKP